MELEFLVPEDKELMNVFFESLEQGDRIPYFDVALRYGILAEEEIKAVKYFSHLPSYKADKVKMAVLNLSSKIKSHFLTARNKSLEVTSHLNYLVILKDEGIVKYAGSKCDAMSGKFRRWYRSMYQADKTNLTPETSREQDRLLFKHSETYRLLGEKSVKIVNTPPPPFERPLPNIKPITGIR